MAHGGHQSGCDQILGGTGSLSPTSVLGEPGGQEAGTSGRAGHRRSQPLPHEWVACCHGYAGETDAEGGQPSLFGRSCRLLPGLLPSPPRSCGGPGPPVRGLSACSGESCPVDLSPSECLRDRHSSAGELWGTQQGHVKSKYRDESV